MVAKAGLHLGTTTVGRILKEELLPNNLDAGPVVANAAE
jgi:hypothetical protein